MQRSKWAGFGVIASGVLVSTGQAHHSGTMFDASKEIQVAGTVHLFEWTNPHVFIEVMVDGPNGPSKFIIEGPTPGVLRGHDWKFNSLKPGDKVVATVRPLREGKPGGYLVRISKDGVPVGDGETSSATIKDNK